MKRYGPDSLHSWFIAINCSLISMLLYGVVRLSGVLFVASMSRFQVNRQQASLPYILCDCLQAMAGPLAGFLSVKFGTRSIVTLGSLIAALGTGGCFFADTIGTVTVLWGVVYGFGFGLSSLLLIVVITQHFLTKRATAIGIMYFGSYIGFSILPSITDFLIETYGLSGTFLCLSGILLHCIPLSMLLSAPKSTSDDKNAPTNSGSAREPCMSAINGRSASLLMEPQDTSIVEPIHDPQYEIRKSRSSLKETLKSESTDVIPIAFRKLSEKCTENNWIGRTTIESSSSVIGSVYIVNGLETKYTRQKFKSTSNSSFGVQNNGFVSDVISKFDIEESLNTEESSSYGKEKHCIHLEDSAQIDAIKGNGIQNNRSESEDITNQSLKKSPSNAKLVGENKLNYEDSPESNTITLKNNDFEKEDESAKRQSNHNLLENIHYKSVCTPNANRNSKSVDSVTDTISFKAIESHFKDPESVLQVSTVPVKNNEPTANLSTCMKTVKELSGDNHRSLTNIKPSKENWTTRDALKIFSEPVFLLVLFSAAMFVSSFITFITVIVDFTMDAGLQESDGKYVIMAFSVASNVGLLSFGWVTDGGYMTLTNFAGLLFLVRTITLGFVPFSNRFCVLLGIVSIHGFFECSLSNIFPLIIAAYYTEDIHELAISCTLFMCGPTYLVTPPLIGYFRDGLGSYLYLFLLMAITSLTCSILLFFTPILAKCRCGSDDRILRKRNT